MKIEGTQTKIYHRQIVSLPLTNTRTESKSFWHTFSHHWLPTNILASHAGGIRKDLREGTTQISEL